MKFDTKTCYKIALCTCLFVGPTLIQPKAVSQDITPISEAAPTLTGKPSETIGNLPIKKTNDPFANTVEMLRKVTTDNPVTNTLSALTGSMNMRLRGAVIDDEGNSLALLEIGNGLVHVVKVGDTLSLKTHDKNSSVKIMAIHRQSVELEFGDFDEFVVVR